MINSSNKYKLFNVLKVIKYYVHINVQFIIKFNNKLLSFYQPLNNITNVRNYLF